MGEECGFVVLVLWDWILGQNFDEFNVLNSVGKAE